MCVQIEIDRIKMDKDKNQESANKFKYVEQAYNALMQSYKFMDFVTPLDMMYFDDSFLGKTLNMDRDHGFFASKYRALTSTHDTKSYTTIKTLLNQFQPMPTIPEPTVSSTIEKPAETIHAVKQK